MTTTTVTPTTQAGTVHNFATGAFTSDGNVTIVKLGFTARYFRVINDTDTIVWEKLEGEAAANCGKVTSTTQSIETSSDILFNTDNTVNLSATLVGTSKAIRWMALG